MKEKKELLSFSRSAIFQCLLMFAGICAGLWIDGYFLVVAAGITLVTAMFTKCKNVYYQLLFCLPFTMIYKMSPTSTSLFAYVMLIVGVVLIIKLRTFGSLQFLLITIFGVYAFMGMGDNVTTVIKMFMGLTLFYNFVKRINPSDFKNQILSFALGMVGSSCIGLLRGNWYRLDAYYTDIDYVSVDGTNLIRFSGLYPDPNYYSISVIVAITLCLLLFFRKEGNRGLLGILIIALSVFGFISYSKLFLLAIIIVAVVFFFVVVKSVRKRLTTLVVAGIGGLAVFNWMRAGNYLRIMLERLSGEDISTGRFSIWENYLTYIWNSPRTFLFGDGLGAEYRVIGGPHNTYIESIFFIGVIGSVLLTVTLITIFKSRSLINRKRLINYLLVAVFLVMISTLGCLTVNDLMFYCMLIWISLNFDFDSKRIR